MNRNKKNIAGTSAFLNVFGDSDKAKVLDFFIENKIFEYTIEETVKATSIQKEKVEEIISLFFEMGILAYISSSKGQFYTLTDTDLAKSLLSVDNELTESNTRLIEKEEKGVGEK